MKTVSGYTGAEQVHPEAKRLREEWKWTKVDQIAGVLSNTQASMHEPPANTIERVVLWRDGVCASGATVAEAARSELLERIDDYRQRIENCGPGDWPVVELAKHVTAKPFGEVVVLSAADTEEGREAMEEIVERLVMV